MKKLCVFIIVIILFGSLISIKGGSMELSNSVLDDSEQIIIKNSGVTHLVGKYSASEINEMRSIVGTRDPEKNYNIIIDGKGTGLTPPTEEGWESMMDVPVIRGVEKSAKNLQADFDLSTDPCFPTIGDQEYQGSCVGWAVTYYAYGYVEAVDNGWTEASTGNPDQLLSPAWSYNMVNGGRDWGSWAHEHGDILTDWGASTLSNMPYDDNDWTSWGNEDAFRNAPLHRAKEFNYIDFNETTIIDTVKSFVAGGTPVTFGLDADEYDWSDGNYIISSSEYESVGANHENTIVGYNDSITDDGDIGAFKIANSWGTEFGDSGYYWLTYEGFKEINEYLLTAVIIDKPDYSPSLLATWEFTDGPERHADMFLGVGDHASPAEVKNPWYQYSYSGVEYTFPEFMCLDVTEFQDEFDAGKSSFYLEITLNPYYGNGNISEFFIERYDDDYIDYMPNYRTPGSPDVTQFVPGYVTANMGLVHNIDKASSHTTIQKAIDNASIGNNILASAGTYYENAVIDKSLSLTGEDTVIDASGLGTCALLTADGVNINGLMFTESGLGPEDAGIKLQNVQNCTIEECNISLNNYGVFANASGNNQIYHNSFFYNMIQAYDNGNNSWDNGYPSGGNYWHDVVNDVHAVDNDTYYALGGELGFFLDSNIVSIPDFLEIIDLYRMRCTWDFDWSFVYEMEEGSDYILNQSTGWVDITWSPLWLGDQFYVDYSYRIVGAPDDFNGPAQDIPGMDLICDDSYLINGGSNVDNYPLMGLTYYTDAHTIQLSEGWNLISLPFDHMDTSISRTLTSISGKWDRIMAYDPTKEMHWLSINTARPDQLNSLADLSHTIAFWINITEPNVELKVFGIKEDTTSIQLYAGWNLVGYPTQNSTTTIANALWGTGADKVEAFNATELYNLKEVGPTYVMKPGEGYWVHVPADTVWLVDW